MTSNVQRVTAALVASPRRTVKQLARLTGLPIKAVGSAVHGLVREGRLQAFPGPARQGCRGRPELSYSLSPCSPACAPPKAPTQPANGLTGRALMGRSALELAWAGMVGAAGGAPGAQRRAA